jgi:toxin ParE1/3/4
MLVEWRPQARESLQSLLTYIADRNQSAARALADDIERATSALPEHPYLYRHGRVAGTRDLVVHPNYRIVYRVTLSSIEVINVLHARQKYP